MISVLEALAIWLIEPLEIKLKVFQNLITDASW